MKIIKTLIHLLIVHLFLSCAVHKTIILEEKHENGKIKYVIPLENNVIQDTAEVFRESGYPMYSAIFENGKLNGPELRFYDRNLIKRRCTYKNGKKDGFEESFFRNGKLKSKRVYIDNVEQINQFQSFDSLGNLLSQWVPGKKNTLSGILSIKYQNGNPKSECFYEKGIKAGKCIHWDKGTGTKFEYFFQKGKLDSSRSLKYLEYVSNIKNKRAANSILRIVRKNTPNLRDIYNRYLRKGKFNSKVHIKFEIDKYGNVIYVLPLKARPMKKSFLKEILNYTWTWSFEPINGEESDLVTIPFTFTSN